MRHLCEISDDELTIDIFSYSDRELRLVSREAHILEDFLDPDGVSLLIRDFDPDEPKSWYRCLDTDRLRLQSEREILF